MKEKVVHYFSPYGSPKDSGICGNAELTFVPLIQRKSPPIKEKILHTLLTSSFRAVNVEDAKVQVHLLKDIYTPEKINTLTAERVGISLNDFFLNVENFPRPLHPLGKL